MSIIKNSQECAIVSIIVVCKNSLPNLKTTIKSIKNQTNNIINTIIIDGNSNDGTKQFIELTRNDYYYCISEKDDGIYDAMNKGWLAAPNNSYILYLGAGDLIFSLPSQEEIIKYRESGNNIIIGTCQVGDITFTSRWTKELFFRNTAHHQSLLIQKTKYPTKPFDERLKIYGDWDFNIRLLKNGEIAFFSSSFKTYAEPGGASWRHNLSEIAFVAKKNNGYIIGGISFLLNLFSRIKREIRR